MPVKAIAEGCNLMAKVKHCDVHWMQIIYASSLADTCMSGLPGGVHARQPAQAPCMV